MSKKHRDLQKLMYLLRNLSNPDILERAVQLNTRRARMFANRFSRAKHPGPSAWPSWREIYTLALEAIVWALRQFQGQHAQHLNAFLNAVVQEVIRRHIRDRQICQRTQEQIYSHEKERIWREKTTLFTVRQQGKWVQARELCAPSAEEEVMREEARRRFRELVEQLPEEEKKRLLVLLGWEEGKGVRKGEEGAFLERVREKLRTMVTEEEWEWLRRWLLE